MTTIPIRHIGPDFAGPGFSGSFKIRDLATLLSGKDMIQELHRHSFFYILVLEKGAGEHNIDFVPYKIHDRSVFVMRPGQVHRLVLKRGSKGFLVEFTKDFYAPLEKEASNVLRRVSSKNFCSPDTARFKKIWSVVAAIFEEYNSKQDRYREVIRAGLDIFFIQLLRQSKRPKQVSKQNTEYRQGILEHFQELIEQHLSEQKPVTFYTEQLHLSTYQLNAITKAMLGKTSSALIDDQIILEAKRSLLATSDQVNQIAWQLGYEDPAYFIRFFKKHTGLTPEAFRVKFK